MARGPDKQFDREQVLDRALTLFWEQGYEGTGVTELIEHMGIGRQSLYDTFGSKRELYLEALRRYAAQRVAGIREVLMREGPVKANIFEAIEVGRRMSREGCGCMLGNSAAEVAKRDPEVAEIVRAKFRALQHAMTDAFGRAREAGEIPAHLEPAELGQMVLVIAQGGALISKLEGDEFLDGVMRGLRSMLEVHPERHH